MPSKNVKKEEEKKGSIVITQRLVLSILGVPIAATLQLMLTDFSNPGIFHGLYIIYLAP
jgi:hypothetical protein